MNAFESDSKEKEKLATLLQRRDTRNKASTTMKGHRSSVKRNDQFVSYLIQCWRVGLKEVLNLFSKMTNCIQVLPFKITLTQHIV